MATTASTATAGLYEPHPVNYAMKPEKNLPPTPPGKYILLLICFARIDFSGRRSEYSMKTCDLTQITDKLNIVFSTLHHEWDSNSQL
jgi:hypothetical protein